jgi:hypothetical protein
MENDKTHLINNLPINCKFLIIFLYILYFMMKISLWYDLKSLSAEYNKLCKIRKKFDNTAIFRM